MANLPWPTSVTKPRVTKAKPERPPRRVAVAEKRALPDGTYAFIAGRDAVEWNEPSLAAGKKVGKTSPPRFGHYWVQIEGARTYTQVHKDNLVLATDKQARILSKDEYFRLLVS